jgi:hypothetical protein
MVPSDAICQRLLCTFLSCWLKRVNVSLQMRRRQSTTAAAVELKATVAAKTAVATLAQLQLQLQRQVMPVQAHLQVLCARAAAATTSEQLEAVATGSVVLHVTLQRVIILFPALRGPGAACTLRFELLPTALMHMVTMCTTCQATCNFAKNKCVLKICHAFTSLIATCTAHMNTSKPCCC